MACRLAPVVALISLASAVALAQQQPNRPVVPMMDGGVDQVLQSIVIPPIPHEPFTATLQTEWVRYTQDGATITWVNQRHVARAEDGRVYEERWLLVPKDAGIKSRMNWIQFADPTQKTLYNCDVFRHICHLETYDPRAELAAATAPPWTAGSGSINNGKGITVVENLGTTMIAGVDATGQRVTTTYFAGTLGNNKDVRSYRETWRSSELAISLKSIVSGPTIGDEIFTITNLTLGPPNPALFNVPDGYSVQDERRSRAEGQ